MSMHVRTYVAVLLGASVLLAACGGGSSTTTAGSSGAAGQAVAVEMRDIAFSPTSLSVHKGDTVTFTFTNKGSIEHEALIGDDAAQTAHEHDMAGSASTDSSMGSSSSDGMGGMGSSSSMSGMDHGGSDLLTVAPGKSGTLTHTFTDAGTVIIGCHEAGHYAAGMKIVVTVT